MTFLSNIEEILTGKTNKNAFYVEKKISILGVNEKIARNKVNLHMAIDFNQCCVTQTDLVQKLICYSTMLSVMRTFRL